MVFHLFLDQEGEAGWEEHGVATQREERSFRRTPELGVEAG
ncbi:hypothetical protein ACGFNX_26820 [Streptomyces sp. NPDC048723]